MTKVRVLDDAAEELDNAVALLENERAGYGLVFLEVYADKLKQLAYFPASGAVVRVRTTGYEVRSFALDRFRYSLIVRIAEGEATIIAVAHQSRRPGYWRDRLATKGDG